MNAKDLMVPLNEFLTPDMPVKEAARILRAARRGEERVGVKGLPVLDDDGKMIGFLSIGDILKAVFPHYMGLSNIGEFSWDGFLEMMCGKVADRKVGEMMTREVVSVPENASVMACVEKMLKSGVKRLPVLTAEGQVSGILYERDVFLAITDVMLATGGKGSP